MEKSPSPVYGARLELVYALIAHRGFESLLLRQENHVNRLFAWFLFYPALFPDIKLVYGLNAGNIYIVSFQKRSLSERSHFRTACCLSHLADECLHKV